MRILAISDVHGNVSAVSRMREWISNDYDLIIVAGDIGGTAKEIFSILDTFGVPVAYVYGNHDFNADYDCELGAHGHHLHGAPLMMNDVAIAGFSGCPTNWGKNPIAFRLIERFNERHSHIVPATNTALNKYPKEWVRQFKKSKSYFDEFEHLDRSIVIANIREAVRGLNDNIENSKSYNIFVTHERIRRVPDNMEGIDCFIFGHQHKFTNTIHNGFRFLNVAALDKPISVIAPGASGLQSLRRANAGNFVTFEIRNHRIENILNYEFGWDSDKWMRYPEIIMADAPYVGEDPSRDTCTRA